MANVFISHSGADMVWADTIRGWLDEDEHDPFLDRNLQDGIVVGDDWERRLYERLRWADAVVCIESERYSESVWCAGEIGAACALGVELLPVRTTPGGERHRLLKSIQGVDAAKDPDAARARLLARLRAIDGGGGWGWPDGQSPYPGLRAFELGEHRVFFGRSREITGIADRLRSPERSQPAILAVVGPSGCGKSSLVRAGVLPRIAGEDYWLTLPPIVPGTDPLGSLARAIAELVGQRHIPIDVTSLRKDLERDGLKAIANDLLFAATANSKCMLLITIDQFEELMTLTEPAKRSEFVTALAPAVGGPVQVLATLRPEFLGAVSKDADLKKLVLRTSLVRPLDTEALREVIEQPAKVAGLHFEDGLVDRLITDTGSGEALPLLAFTLEQLAHGVTRGGCLTQRRYDDIGEVQGALRRQAEEALAAARSATGMTTEQVIAELLNFVNIDEEGRPTKRRRLLSGSSNSAACLEPFLAGRLLSTESVGDTTLITVAHDAFLTNWPPLAKEIDDHVTALRGRQTVENSAKDWIDNGRDPACLLQELPLAKAMADTGATVQRVTDSARGLPAGLVSRWRGRRTLTTRVDLNDVAREFLMVSDDAERSKRTRARAKWTAAFSALALVAVVAVGGFIYAIGQQARAESNEHTAIAERLIAQSQVALSKANHKTALQELLTGQYLADSAPESRFYPMVVSSAATYKIMENPARGPGEDLFPIQTAAISPDGQLLASGGNDHAVRIWEAGSGTLHRAPIELPDAGTIWSVAFDPGGTRIAVGSNDGLLQIFNVDTGERVGAPMPHGAPVSSLAFGHGGQWIATADQGGNVRVWDAGTGAALVTIPAADPGMMARSVAFSPVTDSIAAGGNDNKVRLWDARDGHQLATPAEGQYPVMSVAFDSGGDRLVAGRMDGTIETLNGHDLTLQGVVQAFPSNVQSVAFSFDGTRIVSGGDENTVKVWDARTLDPFGNPFRGHTGAVSSVAFSRDGTRIVSGSFDGSVREWDAVMGLSIPAGQGDAIRAVAFSPDEHTMASGGTDGTVKLWDSRTATFMRRIGESSDPGLGHGVNSLQFYQGGNRLATAYADGRVLVWNTATGQLIAELRRDYPPGGPPIPHRRINSVAVDSHDKYIAAGGFDGLVWLWDANTLTPAGVMHAETTDDKGESIPYQVWSVAFSPNGQQLVTGSGFDPTGKSHNLIQVWDVTTRTPQGDPLSGEFPDANIYAVSFDLDGRRVIAGSSDGTVRVWDVALHKETTAALSQDQNPVSSLALANKSPWIATGGASGLVRVWDMVNDPPAGTPLDGHRKWVHSVAISPDDRLILSGSADGTLQLWPGPAKMRDVICSKLATNVSHKQWDEWVAGKVSYEAVCQGLDPAPDG